MRWFRRRNPTTIEQAIDLAIAEVAESHDAGATAGAEIAAGIVGRSLALADGRPSCLSPADMSRIGRGLVMQGESALRITLRGSEVVCIPASTFYVLGHADPSTWTYTLTTTGPSDSDTRTVQAAGVLHFVWQSSDAAPWLGISPLDTATGALSASLDSRMQQEASGPVGRTIPVPKAAPDELKQVRDKVNDLKGRVLLVETTASGFAGGKSEAPLSDWRSHRLGADYPASVVQARQDAMSAVLASCGIPPSLCWPSGATDSREAFRRFLHGTLQPLGEQLSAEMSDKLEEQVTLTFDRLGAADIAGRARAFGSLVQGGYSAQEAAEATMLPIPAQKPPEAAESDSEAAEGKPVDGPADTP